MWTNQSTKEQAWHWFRYRSPRSLGETQMGAQNGNKYSWFPASALWPLWSASLLPRHTGVGIYTGQGLRKQPNKSYPMFIARAPLFTLGLCLGGFICILPSSTATDLSTQENYPDGSYCTRCFLDSSTTDCSLAHFAYNIFCPVTGYDCDGVYYPLDTSWQNIDSTGAIRDCVSSNKCVYYSYDYQNWGDWVSMQYCCFKPGSPVCISNFLVH